MKRLISLLLCALLLCSLSTAAFASYSYVADTGVKLQLPRRSTMLSEPFDVRVLGCGENGGIYMMPKPEPGWGVLGTVAKDATVRVLAEYGDFYFFQTQEGYFGWNGKVWFEPVEAEAGAESAEEAALPVSDKGVELAMPDEKDYFARPFVRTVYSGDKEGKGTIYLMPQPESGHGTLGTVKDGKTVIVLAEHDGFYFFRTLDGRYGWNGFSWFYE